MPATPTSVIPELKEKIHELKNTRNAIILCHNYQRGEVQEVADYIGDSLGLSIQAAKTDAAVIIFCGVHFMAETAAVVCPDKTVILPDTRSGCPMADMIDIGQLRDWKARYPGAAVVCYVNTTADVKAESDVCCTSANAVEIVNKLPQQDILFVPDKSLAAFVQKHTTKNIIAYPGYCPTHHRLLPEDILQMKMDHPEGKVLAHPECTPETLELADYIGSTAGIVEYAHASPDRLFIVATEEGTVARMKRELPEKEFLLASRRLICPNMKMHNLEKVYWALEEMETVITVPEPIRTKAMKAIDTMLAMMKN